MLDNKRIKEAESNVRSYLAEGLLKQIKIKDNNAKSILVKNSRESLNVSKILFTNRHSFLWTLVTAYYSMYYIAKAVLYEMNYKVEHKISHKVVSDALIAYVRKKLKESLIEDYETVKEEALELAGVKADELVKEFDKQRTDRERFQYSMTEMVMEQKAKTALDRAEKFVLEMEKLL